MSEWQPINTAPKDGQPILVYEHPHITTAKWEPFENGRGEWCLIINGSYAEDNDVRPSHWQPLPEPPFKRSEYDYTQSSLTLATARVKYMMGDHG